MTEIASYFHLIRKTEKVVCYLCKNEVDLNKGFEELEKHMKAKHLEKNWQKERFIKGNKGEIENEY